jgi:hypothetical protein
LSSEERDYIEETIEIILAEFEELQVLIQFREDPDVAKKISDSLKTTVATRRTRVGHITGIPVSSSDLTSLVCRVQEKLTEEDIRSIHTKSSVKATKTDQEADFAADHKKLVQEANDHNHETNRLRQLCAKHQIHTTTRKQQKEQQRAQRASKDKSAKKSTTASTVQAVTDDTAAGADA